ncbi:MAG: flavodoxin [Clostridia bacterium]|nr:flavodoxin [Clostridia bacterium]
MNTAIAYYSKHHGNTKKLLDAIRACDDTVTLIDVTEDPEAELASYDRIGFASGIYFTAFAKQIVAFADKNLPEGKEVFYLYTHGAPAGFSLKEIRRIAKARNCRELGSYHCFGYDTFGPFKVIGGIAKGHPDEKELKGAAAFYRSL